MIDSSDLYELDRTSAATSFNKTQFAKTFSHHTATVNSVRLHYVMGGQGNPIVLLHGWPQTWYAWRRVMPILAEHYTVIAPDVRGYGDSARPSGGYSKRTAALDIYELVQLLGWDRIFLVGHDMGGMVAYAYAANYSNQVRRLVLIDTLIPGFGLEEAMDVAKGGSFHFGFHANSLLAETLVKGREREYLSYMIGEYIYNPSAISDTDLDEYVRCYSMPGALWAGFEHYRALLSDGQENRQHFTTKLAMSVLAVVGKGKNAGMPKALEAIAADVRGEVIDRCGHFIAEERPISLAHQLLDFFQEEND